MCESSYLSSLFSSDDVTPRHLKAAADAIDTPTCTHVSVADAIKDAQASSNSIIVIAGSLYLVAEARALLQGDRV